MAADVQLSGNLWLHEFPCWQKATAAQVAALAEWAQRVGQPVREVFGPLVPTSWIWWSDGCTKRTGAHAWGSTVDFVVPGTDLHRVWAWGKTYLLPSGYLGRWIYEPQTTTQGEHIHAASRADMLALNGDGRILALEETPSGQYLVAAQWFDDPSQGGSGITGTYLDPIEIEGFTVTAARRAGWSWALGLGLALAAFRHRTN